MSTITLGHADGRPVALDLNLLLRTRLLIQGNSGSGKSWLLRRLAEQLFGKLPVIIIDPEGEFPTLREHYGYVLVGKGGETPADVRSAKLVAEKLLELHASAVCDLYEMKPDARHEWVRIFLEALIEAPKKLWQPLVVAVDEAHLFAPERGMGESPAKGAMSDLATRGRKRGYVPIWATQRLGKLDKTSAAELKNVLIGSTFMDIDQDRAGDALGVRGKDRGPFFDELKRLDEGYFWALGRAISIDRVLVKVGPVTTTHPEPGSTKHAAEPPPAPEKVRAMLPKLADLPRIAEERAQTEADLKKKIRELQGELLKARPTAPPATGTDHHEKLRAHVAEVNRLRGALGAAMKFIIQVSAHTFDVTGVDKAELEQAVQAAVARAVSRMDERLLARGRDIARLRAQAAQLVKALEAVRADRTVEIGVDVTRNEPFTITVAPAAPGRKTSAPPAEGLTGPQQAVLDTVAMLDVRGIRAERDTVARWLGIHPNGGSYGTNLGYLRSGGYLTGFTLTDKGRQAARAQETGLEAALEALEGEPKRLIIRALLGVQPLSRDDLAAKLGLHPNGGSYGTNLGWLRTMGLITPRGLIAVTEGLRR